ncbi:aldose epimerase family protein [Sediminitomix flava]|nr:aldose epimerase family protein [Sediminitomix flava]
MHHFFLKLSIFLVGLFTLSCSLTKEKNTGTDSENPINSVWLKAKNFQSIIEGKPTNLYFLSNSKGARVAITNYGGRIVGLQTPDKNGELRDVVVGFSSLQGYINSSEKYFGALIGRYGNRIAKGQFEIEGVKYQLPINNGVNSLHGGNKGFQDVVWDVVKNTDKEIHLRYIEEDMKEGYPGNLTVDVIYSFSEENELGMSYKATTDRKTVVNLTNHAFFNLNGEGSGSIINHKLQVDASHYSPVDETLITLGVHEKVEGTAFDFRTFKTIGERIEQSDIQLKNGLGYDHNFVLDKGITEELTKVATVVGDQSGIRMDIFTQEPGLQFYSGNFMQSQHTFKSGIKDDFRTAFCLETQHFPNSPNQENYPSTILAPNEVYSTYSVYRFSVIEDIAMQ